MHSMYHLVCCDILRKLLPTDDYEMSFLSLQTKLATHYPQLILRVDSLTYDRRETANSFVRNCVQNFF